MCSIAWCSFSWEAFATLFTGVAAVVGASIIGWRQSEIMAKQTAIAERQAEIEKLSHRSEQFDRRLKVYETAVEWLREFWQHGEAAKDNDLRNRYVWAIETAKFLFRPEVSAAMEDWRKTASRHDILTKMGKHDDADKLNEQLFDVAKTINALFAPEMRLGEAGEVIPVATLDDEADKK